MSADACNYDLQNVSSCKISSRSPRFAKRAITNLSDVLRRRLCLQQPAPACGSTLTHGCVTMLSDSQGCELSHFVLILWCVTKDGNPAFTVYATTHVFDTMLKFNGLAGLPSYLQRNCHIPKHLGKHSSKPTKLKMQIFYDLALTRIESKKLLCIPRVALLVRKPNTWLRLFSVPKHLVMLIIVYQTNTGHRASSLFN